MALTNLLQVRYGVGDITLPYILSDSVITDYLTLNAEDVDDTIDELQPIILSALAARGGNYRVEDLYEDTRGQSTSYIKAIEKANELRASAAYPIIGGSSDTSDDLSLGVDMFDEENDYNDDDTFYNGYEDI